MIKISELPAASALGGTETVAGVQSGVTVKILASAIGTYVRGLFTTTPATIAEGGTGAASAAAARTALGAAASGANGDVTSMTALTVATVAANPVRAGDLQAQTLTAYATGGTDTAFTLTPAPALAALVENQEFDVEFHTAAGATPTLAISGLTAKLLKYRDSTGAKAAVTSTQIPSGWRSRVTYDGTDYIVREIPPVAATSQKIVQVVEATPYTTYSSTAVTIPLDDTIPQNTEGAEWNTVTITPTSATNRLRIEANFDIVGLGASSTVIIALFKDTDADALCASLDLIAGAWYSPQAIVHEMAAGSTSAITFKVRAGSSTTTYINGSSGGRALGGVCAVRMRVTEIAV